MFTYRLSIEFDDESIWQRLESSNISKWVGIDGSGVDSEEEWKTQVQDMENFTRTHPFAVFKLSITNSNRAHTMYKYFHYGYQIAQPKGKN
jgi:hypothetical protein